MFLESFRNAKKLDLDKVAFLRYPYTNQEAIEALKSIDVDIDMEGFSLRERKKKYSLRSSDVKSILDKYSDFDFKE